MRRAARNLAISSKKSLCELKKKESRGRELVHRHARADRRVDVAMASAKVKASSCTAVEPASRIWYPLIEIVFQFGTFVRAVGDHIDHQPQRRFRREDVRAAGEVLLQNVVLDGPVQLGRRAHRCAWPRRGTSPAPARRWRWTSPRRSPCPGGSPRRAAPRRRPSKGTRQRARLHRARGVVGVVAQLRGQVEGDGEAALALLQQVAVAQVGLLGRGVASVLAHRPERPRYIVGCTPRVKGYWPG